MSIQGGHTLKKRYVYKVFANFVTFAIGVVSQALVARGLGPAAFGNYSFLTNFFNQMAAFFDMGSSTAFYAKLSHSQKDHNLVLFYSRFVALVAAALIAFVVCASMGPAHAKIWPNQKVLYVYMAAIFCFLAWVVQVVNGMADAYGLTVAAEMTKIGHKVVGVLLLTTLFLAGKLNLFNYFIYQYFIIILLLLLVLYVIFRSGCLSPDSWKLPLQTAVQYAKRFYAYCHPLFVYSLAALIFGVLDRWMLERFSGSVQQGYYGFSYQIGVICFLFTSAMTPLLMREFSISFGKSDIARMAALFRKYIPILYSVAAFFSCFIVFQAGRVISVMGGDKYNDALWVVTIMALYPIHQTYGQLSASVFYATGQTHLFRNIGIIFLLIGFPLTYFMVAPPGLGGLNMGAAGLAVKIVAVQFAVVNVQLFYNARFLKIRFWKYVVHQIICILSLLGISFVTKCLLDHVVIGLSRVNVFMNLTLSGILYSLAVGVIVYACPMLFGLTREQIAILKESVLNRMRA